MFSKPTKNAPSVTGISFILHLLGFVWYCYGIYLDVFYMKFPNYQDYGGRFQFLTMITAYLIWIATGFATLIDLIQIISGKLESINEVKAESKSMLISIRDELFSYWVITLGAVVPLMFWGIAAIDVDGIYPIESRPIAPLNGIFNHFVHTVSFFYVILLALCVNYMHSSMKRVMVINGLLFAVYLPWLAYCAKRNGDRWSYAFINDMSSGEFALFIAFCYFAFLGVYCFGRCIASSKFTEERRHQYLKDKKL